MHACRHVHGCGRPGCRAGVRAWAEVRMVDALLGTTNGVLLLRDGALVELGLERESVTALHAAGDVLLAGTYGGGLFRSADGGRSWEHIEAGLTASTFRFVSGDLAGSEAARGSAPAHRGQPRARRHRQRRRGARELAAPLRRGPPGSGRCSAAPSATT